MAKQNKPKTEKKPRANKYEEKLKITGTLEEVLSVSLQGADKKKDKK